MSEFIGVRFQFDFEGLDKEQIATTKKAIIEAADGELERWDDLEFYAEVYGEFSCSYNFAQELPMKVSKAVWDVVGQYVEVSTCITWLDQCPSETSVPSVEHYREHLKNPGRDEQR